jgi:N-acetyl-gamma-glutamylphosphate reductase
MVSVGIVGGSGYMGGEALRILLRHPHTEVAWVLLRVTPLATVEMAALPALKQLRIMRYNAITT